MLYKIKNNPSPEIVREIFYIQYPAPTEAPNFKDKIASNNSHDVIIFFLNIKKFF